MSALLEAIRALVEDPDVATDETGAEPYDWRPGTQYVYEADGSPVERAFETGPTARQDFAVRFVYVAEAHEEASRDRDAAVTAALEARRDAVLAAVRANRANATWLHLDAEAEARPPATLTSRAIALRLTGYRFV